MLKLGDFVKVDLPGTLMHGRSGNVVCIYEDSPVNPLCMVELHVGPMMKFKQSELMKCSIINDDEFEELREKFITAFRKSQMEHSSIGVIHPDIKSEIMMANGLKFPTNYPMPCWFHRIMQRIFFGFVWTEKRYGNKIDFMY